MIDGIDEKKKKHYSKYFAIDGMYQHHEKSFSFVSFSDRDSDYTGGMKNIIGVEIKLIIISITFILKTFESLSTSFSSINILQKWWYWPKFNYTLVESSKLEASTVLVLSLNSKSFYLLSGNVIYNACFFSSENQINLSY